MTGAIEFWFDFSSPYAYFAAESIGELEAATGRRVLWRPFLLGAAFKQTGMQPLAVTPMRGDYALRDWQRLARLMAVPFRLPSRHPIAALAAARAFYWIERVQPERATEFALAALRAYFADDRDIADPSVVADIGAAIGLARAPLMDAISSADAKDTLRRRTDEALAKNVFGSPFFIVDGEPFWGGDRMAMVRDWITRGGW